MSTSPSGFTSAEAPAPNHRAEALKESFNAVGLLGVAAASAALLTPIPLIVGLAAEAAYLAFVPNSSWYKGRIEQRQDEQSHEKREAMKRGILPTLRPVLQARWHKIEAARESIVAQGADDRKFFRPIALKLDFLLEKWLYFAQRQAQFDVDLEKAARETRAQSTDATPLIQAAYFREAQALREKAASESSDSSRALLESRAQVLERRREWVGRLSKMRANLEQHLELIEDTFGLVNDQLRARSPEMVLADLQKVIMQTDTTSQLLDEFGTLQG